MSSYRNDKGAWILVNNKGEYLSHLNDCEGNFLFNKDICNALLFEKGETEIVMELFKKQEVSVTHYASATDFSPYFKVRQGL